MKWTPKWLKDENKCSMKNFVIHYIMKRYFLNEFLFFMKYIKSFYYLIDEWVIGM